MVKVNLTLQLDEDVIRRAKAIAAKRGMSVSALVARKVAELAAHNERYEVAEQRALGLMKRASKRGSRGWTRDDNYTERLDRCSVRRVDGRTARCVCGWAHADITHLIGSS
jgi:hypothetical protein